MVYCYFIHIYFFMNYIKQINWKKSYYYFMWIGNLPEAIIVVEGFMNIVALKRLHINHH